MPSYEFDLEALLESDGEGEDLVEVGGRSIDDILNDADLEEDSFSFLQKDAKPGSRSGASKIIQGENLQTQESAEDVLIISSESASEEKPSKVFETKGFTLGDKNVGALLTQWRVSEVSVPGLVPKDEAQVVQSQGNFGSAFGDPGFGSARNHSSLPYSEPPRKSYFDKIPVTNSGGQGEEQKFLGFDQGVHTASHAGGETNAALESRAVEHELEGRSTERLPPLKVNSSMKGSRIWEFNTKLSPFGAPSPFYLRSPGLSPLITGSKPSPRPGAALAAAAAASRQLASPHASAIIIKLPQTPSKPHLNAEETSFKNLGVVGSRLVTVTDDHALEQKNGENKSNNCTQSTSFDTNITATKVTRSSEACSIIDSTRVPSGGNHSAEGSSLDFLSPKIDLPVKNVVFTQDELSGVSAVASHTVKDLQGDASRKNISKQDNTCSSDPSTLDSQNTSFHEENVFSDAESQSDALNDGKVCENTCQDDPIADGDTVLDEESMAFENEYILLSNRSNDQDSHVLHNPEEIKSSSVSGMKQKLLDDEINICEAADSLRQADDAHFQATKDETEFNQRNVKGVDEEEEETTQDLTALSLAEELEKSSATRGLHLEEGAVAQPMRLEGIERGPPAIGLLQVDHGGPLSFALASVAMKREHGVPQSLAIHANFIAVGMSKGTVLVTSSKYSATRATDEADTKAFFLGNAVDKSNTAVTSICFNPHGDMLLAGYANGAVTLWDVARATIAKAVTGEHTVVIVHTIFLEQEVSMTRHLRAISADSKGLVLLHTFTAVPLLRRYSVTTQCLLDGQRTGVVLSLSPLLYDESPYPSAGLSPLQSGGTALTPTGLSSVMGGMVGTVASGVNNDVGRKFLYDGASNGESGGVVALVTHQVALVIRLTPALEVCAKLTRPDGIHEGSIPYTAWRRNHRKMGSPIVCNGSGASAGNVNADNATACDPLEEGQEDDKLPFLAFAWDRKVFITQLLRSELKILIQWDIPTKAAGVAWLGEQILVVLTTNEELHLYTKEGSKLEQANLFSKEMGVEALVYHTHFLNSLGNPEKVYHNALAVRGVALYLLGTQKLWRARLLPWKDRIKVLQNAGDWMGAFQIAMELYDSKAKGVTGLPKRLDALREAIAPSLLDLLSSYIDEAFTYLSLVHGSPLSSGEIVDIDAGSLKDRATHSSSVEPKGLNKMQAGAMMVTKEQYARVGGVAIEFCVHIKRTDMLFESVFEKFSSVGQKGAFLELLEPYILKDMLGQLAPEVMQALVEHYSSRGWLQRVEQCILHMDIASLDFNQVVKLCREHGLYSALIYLFQQGLNDFKSPLEELLVVAQGAERPNAEAFGYKSLVYIKYCFLGSFFPPGQGILAPDRLPLLRSELLELILSPDGKGVVDSQSGQGSAYPILALLLKLDTPATLHVLELAFPKQSNFDAIGEVEDIGICIKLILQKNAYTSKSMNSSGINLIQLTVDALVHILTTSSFTPSMLDQYKQDNGLGVSEKHWPSSSDIGTLFEFLARLVSFQGVVAPKTTLSQILRYLAFGVHEEIPQVFLSKSKSSRRRENLMVKLLCAVSETELDGEVILRHAVEVEFWQVAALLSVKRGDHEAALQSLIKDIEQPQHAFEFILEMLSPDVDLTHIARHAFKETVFAQLPDLISLSSEATLFVMLQHFHEDKDRAMKTLETHPKLLFHYLKAVMNFRSGVCEDGTIFNLNIGSVFSDTYSIGRNPVHGNHRESMISKKQPNFTELLRSSGMEITDEMAELYIQLMCQFEPGSVLKFLQSYENYRLERCLKLCQDYGVTDAAIFLFERVGDIGSALDLILTDLVVLISEMDQAIVSQSRHSPPSLPNKNDHLQYIREVAAVFSVMETAVALCQRNNLRLDQQESEALWFSLLDRFVEPLQDLLSQRETMYHGAVRGFGVSSEKTWSGPKPKYTWRVLKANKGIDHLRMVLVQLVSSIVDGMIGNVPLRRIMEKILENHGSHEFQDFKGTILGMLSSYSYELAILGSAKRLIENDTFRSILALKRSRTHAYAPTTSVCCICNQNFTSQDMSSQYSILESKSESEKLKRATDVVENGSYSAIQVFFCGHGAHFLCLKNAAHYSSSKKAKSVKAVHCPICPRNIKDALLLQIGAPHTDLMQNFSPIKLTGKSSLHAHHENKEGEVYSGPSRFELLKSLQKGKSIPDKSSLLKISLSPASQAKHNKVASGSIPSSSNYAHGSSGASKSKVENPWNMQQKAKAPSIFQFSLPGGVFGRNKSGV